MNSDKTYSIHDNISGKDYVCENYHELKPVIYGLFSFFDDDWADKRATISIIDDLVNHVINSEYYGEEEAYLNITVKED